MKKFLPCFFFLLTSLPLACGDRLSSHKTSQPRSSEKSCETRAEATYTKAKAKNLEEFEATEHACAELLQLKKYLSAQKCFLANQNQWQKREQTIEQDYQDALMACQSNN